MTEDLDIGREDSGDTTILRPVGDIDLSRAPALRNHLGEAMKRRPRRIVVNLEDVPYMDSSGVATFVEALQLSRRAGSRLILCGLQPRVRSIFEIARLDMVFPICADTAEALAT